MSVKEGRAALDLVVGALPPEAKASIDEPANADGHWFLDVLVDDKRNCVMWVGGQGYALWSDPDTGYGVKPDIWLTEPRTAAAKLMDLIAAQPSGPAAT